MILDYREYVLESASSGLVNFVEQENNAALFKHNSMCPFCKIKIDNKVYFKTKKSYPEWLFGSFAESETVIQCPKCGWWEYEYKNSSDAILDGIRASDVKYASAIIKKFDDDSVEIPINILRSYIEKNPETIYSIDAHKMEDLVRSVFKDFYPSCEVKSFGKTHDGGKDGIIINADGTQTLIQIKRRTNSNSIESVCGIRELVGVAAVENSVNGCIFVSTADHFSKDAKQFANKAIKSKIVDKFDLIDYKSFIEILGISNDKMPSLWENLLTIK